MTACEIGKTPTDAAQDRNLRRLLSEQEPPGKRLRPAGGSGTVAA